MAKKRKSQRNKIKKVSKKDIDKINKGIRRKAMIDAGIKTPRNKVHKEKVAYTRKPKHKKPPTDE